VVPELAEVPVLRTVTVQVPLGVELVPGSCWATNGDPPSPIDMIRSTAEAAADAGVDADTKAVASRAAHVVATANARLVARMRTG
jgi:hypothetical protein